MLGGPLGGLAKQGAGSACVCWGELMCSAGGAALLGRRPSRFLRRWLERQAVGGWTNLSSDGLLLSGGGAERGRVGAGRGGVAHLSSDGIVLAGCQQHLDVRVGVVCHAKRAVDQLTDSELIDLRQGRGGGGGEGEVGV